jgi:methylphosphotriester-DNA--protein-cysteine methyltransferase
VRSFVVDLAHEALARVRSRAALATSLDVSKQHLSRVLSGKAGLGPLALVRAARITERNALDVLRAGGEAELADELASLLGDRFTAAQRAFLQEWDRVPVAVRKPLRATIKASASGR